MSMFARMMQKRESVSLATAIPAIPAIREANAGGTVARIATIAVATPTEAKTATAWAWLLHYPDREPVELYTSPESSMAEVLRDFPDAVAAEPIPPAPTRPAKPLTAEVETAIRAWLALIEETDTAIIGDVLGRCRTDPETRAYFTGRASGG